MSLKLLFGEKLKSLRLERGLTQEQFAELIGVEAGFIGSLEIGQKAASFKTLEKISENLKINYYELFDFEKMQSQPSLIKSIIKELNELDDKSLKFVLKNIKDFKKFIQ